MKNVRRFLSLIIVSVMVLAMSLPVFATDVTMGGKGQLFGGYKLLDIESYNADHTQVVYKVRDEYRDVLKKALNLAATATDDEIIKELDTYTADSEELLAVAKAIHNAAGNPVYQSVDDGNKNQVFKNLEEGYYLFIESKNADPADPKYGPFDDFSSPMLINVFDENFTVKKKDGEVTDEKKVKETNDTTGTVTDWQYHGDYDIGDDVPYLITGKVSENLSRYATYKFVIHDEMQNTLKNNKDYKVYLNTPDKDDALIAASNYTVENETDQAFSIKFANLKGVTDVSGNEVKGGDKIYVRFSAKLLPEAVIGNPGNINESWIEYSNNPDNEDDFDTTPKKIVVVFTYKLEVNKIDQAGNKLEGAEFALYKEVATGGDEVAEIGDGKKYVSVALTANGAEFTSVGLDAGNYVLVETKAPDGYNKIDPIKFTVNADFEEIDGKMQIKDLWITPANAFENIIHTPESINAGTVEGDVRNIPGVLLPETGGIGTTIFYIVGALLALGAGVVLVTRRRVQK